MPGPVSYENSGWDRYSKKVKYGFTPKLVLDTFIEDAVELSK